MKFPALVPPVGMTYHRGSAGPLGGWGFRLAGAMAQLVAHLLCKQGVRGSSPLGSTYFPLSNLLSALIGGLVLEHLQQETAAVERGTRRVAAALAMKAVASRLVAALVDFTFRVSLRLRCAFGSSQAGDRRDN